MGLRTKLREGLGDLDREGEVERRTTLGRVTTVLERRVGDTDLDRDREGLREVERRVVVRLNLAGDGDLDRDREEERRTTVLPGRETVVLVTLELRVDTRAGDGDLDRLREAERRTTVLPGRETVVLVTLDTRAGDGDLDLETDRDVERRTALTVAGRLIRVVDRTVERRVGLRDKLRVGEGLRDEARVPVVNRDRRVGEGLRLRLRETLREALLTLVPLAGRVLNITEFVGLVGLTAVLVTVLATVRPRMVDCGEVDLYDIFYFLYFEIKIF